MSENDIKRPKKVIIIGASGHARVIADIVKCSGDEVMGFLDDRNSAEFPNMKILGKVVDATLYESDDVWFVVGIGKNETRERIVRELDNLRYYTAIHHSAVIADDVTVGEGTVVMANTVINTGSCVGRHCIINTASTVDHDNKLSDFVHISPGAHLSGTVEIGEGTWLGTGAVVSNNVNICGGCVIGAGSAVIRDITIAGVYKGVPAKMNTYYENITGGGGKTKLLIELCVSNLVNDKYYRAMRLSA